MLTLVELKRILFKAPVLVMLCFVLPLYVVAGFIVGVTPPKSDLIELGTATPSLENALSNFVSNSESDYHNIKLTERLDSLIAEIERHNPDFDYAKDLLHTFKVFQGSDDTIGGYLGVFYYDAQQTTDTSVLAPRFADANKYFWIFSDLVNEYVTRLKRVEIPTNNLDTFMHAVEQLRECFDFQRDETFIGTQYTFQNFFRVKRMEISAIWTDESGSDILGILESAGNISLTAEQQSELLNIYENQVRGALSDSYADVLESQSIEEFQEQVTRYSSLAEASADLVSAHVLRIQNSNAKTSADIAVLDKLIFNRAAPSDYSSPFTFMQVMHAPTGTSVYDFVFNCFEIVSIPLIVFAVIVVVFCIYDDIKKRTVYQTLISPQGRKRIIGAKLLAVMWTIALVMAVFFALFYLTATIMLGASAAPPLVLTVFGGEAVMIAPLTLLLLNIGSLFFKILFFAAWAAFISVNANTATSIITRIFIYIAVVLLANFFLSAFAFYQFIPFLALEFIQYLGVKPMLLWQSAPHYLWFITLPIMLAAWFLLIVGTIKRFNKRDF